MTIYSQLLQYLFTGIAIGCIYALVALGFTIIYNTTGIINFTQGEFVMLGGMFMVLFTNVMGIPMYLGAFLTLVAVSLIGAAFAGIFIVPLHRASVLTMIIITIGGSITIRELTMMIAGKESFALPHFTSEVPHVIFGATILPQTLWIILTLLGCMAGLYLFFRFTMMGKAMQACAAHHTGARIVGVRVQQMVLLSFILSAMLGAAGGVVVTPITLVDYHRGTMLALKGFGCAILGGLGNAPGALLGGFIVGILESLGAGYISSGYKDAIALVVLLGVLFFKPSGLLGKKDVNAMKEF